MTQIALLPHRGVVEVAGEDRVGFLQGLVSNDVSHASPGQAVWAGYLTPQGRFLHEMLMVADGDRLLLEVERERAGDLVTRLSRFRLRSHVAIVDRSAEFAVLAGWGAAAPETAGIIVADPRLPQAGWRILAPVGAVGTATLDAWDHHRIALGLPDGSRDLEPDRTLLLEAGFDELNGVSWTKGCYMGQELTARTKYRGLVKRRLVPVEIAGDAPPPGAAIMADGMEAGTMRSAVPGLGLAMLRVDRLDGALAWADSRLTVRQPAWLKLPSEQTA